MSAHVFGGSLAVLARKEFREALRGRWLIGFAAGFAFLTVGVSLIGSLGATVGGHSGFGRTSAALVNLILIAVPLAGFLTGSLALAGERERGTLPLLLAMPVHSGEVFWAKWTGLAAALAVCLALAFGAAGFYLALAGGLRDGWLYAQSFVLTLLLGLSSLSLGLLITSLTRRTAAAAGLALIAWLALIVGGDLGILSTALAMKLQPAALLGTVWLNPLSLYRLLAAQALGAHLEMMGPAGLCAQDHLGNWLTPALLGGLFLWIAAPLTLAYLFYRRDPLREE